MQKIIIASKNPVKIKATEKAFQKVFPGKRFEFQGVSVSSGVSDQPFGDKRILAGAKNRAKNAMKDFPGASYWVGIEGGVEEMGEGMGSFSWAVIKSQNKEGKARGNTYFLPKRAAKLVRGGKELGEANDIIFDKNNSKQKNGAIGTLTDNLINRTDYYSNLLLLALIPFKNPDLY